MRILYLSPTANPGGAERCLLELLGVLRAQKSEWELGLIVSTDGPLAEKAANLGVRTEVLRLPLSVRRLGDSGAGGAAGHSLTPRSVLRRCCILAPSVAPYLARLRRKIREFAPTIVHSNGIKMHIMGALARPQTVKLIWHIHDYVGRRPVAGSMLRVCSSRCAGAIATSRSVATDFLKLCPFVETHPIYNAIDLTWFQPRGEHCDLDQLAGVSKATTQVIRVGLIGTMARWKGHEVFLRAISMIDAAIPVRGYIIGAPIYDTVGSQYSIDELRRLANQVGVAGKTGFTGFIDDPARAIRALDIVVHASTEPEPFGRVIAEAMACGKAVIASDAGGARELVCDGENGLLHAPGNPSSLAQCITRLSSDGALRARISNAALETAERRFGLPRFAQELIPVYERFASQ